MLKIYIKYKMSNGHNTVTIILLSILFIILWYIHSRQINSQWQLFLIPRSFITVKKPNTIFDPFELSLSLSLYYSLKNQIQIKRKFKMARFKSGPTKSTSKPISVAKIAKADNGRKMVKKRAQNGSKVLKDIRQLQKTTNLLIAKAPFIRVVS